jgi:hypothetical protein
LTRLFVKNGHGFEAVVVLFRFRQGSNHRIEPARSWHGLDDYTDE